MELLDLPDDGGPPRHSSFRLEITLAVGYKRQRARAGKLESSLVTLGLLVGSIAFVLVFLWLLSQWRV